LGLAASGTLAAVVGSALGYRLFGPNKPTQAERDSFEIPGLYPVLRRKYGIDDLYMAIVRWIRGPLAGFINWTNGHIFDFLVNGAGFAGRGLAKIVYGFDQSAIDGVFNASGAGAGAVSSVLRRTQTGKVQTYATAIFGAVVVLVAGFVFLR